MMDKWIKYRKGHTNITYTPDIIIASILRLIGKLCFKSSLRLCYRLKFFMLVHVICNLTFVSQMQLLMHLVPANESWNGYRTVGQNCRPSSECQDQGLATSVWAAAHVTSRAGKRPARGIWGSPLLGCSSCW